jgi:hypothetical protein
MHRERRSYAAIAACEFRQGGRVEPGTPTCVWWAGSPAVGILFIDFESPRRLRVNGRASLSDDDPLLSQFEGAKLIVRVKAEAIFPNCPRYIHKMQTVEPSIYVPCKGFGMPSSWRSSSYMRTAIPAASPPVLGPVSP